MIEYLHRAVKATAGKEVVITAKILDDNITTDCKLCLYDDKKEINTFDNYYDMDNETLYFILPADAFPHTGRYFYTICHYGASITNKEPLYIL